MAAGRTGHTQAALRAAWMTVPSSTHKEDTWPSTLGQKQQQEPIGHCRAMPEEVDSSTGFIVVGPLGWRDPLGARQGPWSRVEPSPRPTDSVMAWVQAAARCDGKPHCADQSDEEDCPACEA